MYPKQMSVILAQKKKQTKNFDDLSMCVQLQLANTWFRKHREFVERDMIAWKCESL
jgi:hypothetical protein